MAVIGSLSVKLGLVTVEWDKATAKAKQEAKDLQTAFKNIGNELGGVTKLFNSLGGALGISTIGFTALAASTMSYANDIKDLSQGFGISVAKTLQFRHAIEVSGGSADQAGKILSKLFSTLSSAQEGNTKAIRTFEDLGITWREISTMSPEKAIDRTFEALAKGENVFKNVAAAREFLGKGGFGLDLKGVNEELSKTTLEYQKQQDAILKVGQANDTLKTTMDNLRIAMASLMAPFVNKDNVVSIELFKTALIGIGSLAIISAINTARVAVLELATAISILNTSGGMVVVAPWVKNIIELATKLRWVIGAAALLHSGNLGEGEDEEIRKINAELKAQKDQEDADAKKALEDTPAVKAIKSKIKLTKDLMELESKAAQIKAEGVWTDEYTNKNKEIEIAREKERLQILATHQQYINSERHTAAEIAADRALQAAELKAADQKALDAHRVLTAQMSQELSIMRLQSQLKFDMAKFDEASLLLNHKKSRMSEYDYNVANEVLTSQRKILQLREKMAELPQGADAQGRQHYEAQRKAIQDEIDIEVQLSNTRMQIFKEDEAHRRSFSYGWEEAYFKYKQDASNAAAMGAQAFSSMTSAMNSAIDSFVENGKASFKDMIGSMIKELMKFYLKAQATGLLGMIGDKIGGIFGGALPDSQSLDYYLSFNGKATGGDVQGGQPYLVGENGPELFVPPKSGGSIIPNMQMPQAMSGNQPQVVYNGPYIANMSAIDTQSGIQFLAKNKNAVWAANQSAQRGMPTSR